MNKSLKNFLPRPKKQPRPKTVVGRVKNMSKKSSKFIHQVKLPKIYVCSYCPEKYCHLKFYREHLRVNHPEADATVYSPFDDALYPPDSCNVSKSEIHVKKENTISDDTHPPSTLVANSSTKEPAPKSYSLRKRKNKKKPVNDSKRLCVEPVQKTKTIVTKDIFTWLCHYCVDGAFHSLQKLNEHIKRNHCSVDVLKAKISCKVLKLTESFYSSSSFNDKSCSVEKNKKSPRVSNLKKGISKYYTCDLCPLTCNSLKKYYLHFNKNHTHIGVEEPMPEIKIESITYEDTRNGDESLHTNTGTPERKLVKFKSTSINVSKKKASKSTGDLVIPVETPKRKRCRNVKKSNKKETNAKSTEHSLNDNIELNGTQKDFKCSFCDQKFSDHETLDSHVESHKNLPLSESLTKEENNIVDNSSVLQTVPIIFNPYQTYVPSYFSVITVPPADQSAIISPHPVVQPYITLGAPPILIGNNNNDAVELSDSEKIDPSKSTSEDVIEGIKSWMKHMKFPLNSKISEDVTQSINQIASYMAQTEMSAQIRSIYLEVQKSLNDILLKNESSNQDYPTII